jgi:hypothetical protein
MSPKLREDGAATASSLTMPMLPFCEQGLSVVPPHGVRSIILSEPGVFVHKVFTKNPQGRLSIST